MLSVSLNPKSITISDTELDSGIQTVIDALQEKSMWEHTVLIFVSDNGGPLDHCTNSPLRGGKCVSLNAL